MSVLIKNMEMPKNCAECQFRQYEYCDLQRQDVYAVNIMDYALSLARHPNCPLVELPFAEELAEKLYKQIEKAVIEGSEI